MRKSERVITQPLLHNTFVERAQARMVGLRTMLVDARSLKNAASMGAAFIQPVVPTGQTVMDVTK